MISLFLTEKPTSDTQADLAVTQSKAVMAPGVETRVNMLTGAHYLLAQDSSGENKLLKELVAVRKGDDLIIFSRRWQQDHLY